MSVSLCVLCVSDACRVDSGILSALCLPPVERGVNSGAVYSVCSQMDVESEDKTEYTERSGSEQEREPSRWLGVGSDVKVELDAAALEPAAVEGNGSGCDAADERPSRTLIIGEDGQVTVLGSEEKKPIRRGRKKKRPADEDFVVQGAAKDPNMDPDFEVFFNRPVRKNRGLKMKRYLSQWRKQGKSQAANSPRRFPRAHDGSGELEERTCRVCGKVVSHVKFLERHMSIHAGELPFSCPLCKKFYKSLRYLQIHKCQSLLKEGGASRGEEDEEDEEGEGEEQPEAAAAAADDQPPAPDLSGSDNTAEDPDYSPSKSGSKEPGPSPEGPFYCPHCSVEFKCKQTFRFHLRNICYNEQQVDPEKADDVKHCFRCDECDKAFKYKSTLDSHKQTHNPLYCEVCMKLVRDPEALAMHKKSHTPFQCNQCEENFPVFKALHKHYIDVHNPVEPFTCTHCDTTFASLKRFIRHEWKHTGYQPFQCPHCSKRFRSYSDLVEHQKKHTKAYPFLCWECGKKFRHGVTLTRHVERVHHSGEPVSEKPLPTFTCTQCGKAFTSRRCLLKHDNFHHKGLRFPCEHCGKGFFGKDALVRHTLIHTGERPFKCDDCDKSFRSSAELKIHRRYHTGERPFKCNICDKGFVQSCFLTLHMRTHTGERPYICSVCNKGFSSLHGLKRHRRLVHA